jgi:[protein-PII] uridylyltransferase
LCSPADRRLRRPEVLYVAGLFHDIAKGRGGDHSALGSRDAVRFCRQHGLSREDTELVGWLVEQHLTMSLTAQKQDITDPNVVAAFVAKVGTERRLAALYLLTVADIRGTSPRVWNAWKAKLLEDLFHAAQARLTGDSDGRGLQDSLDARRAEAGRRLRLYAVPDGAEQRLWQRLDGVYFQRHAADEIAWHARHLYFRVNSFEPVVKTSLAREGAGLQVMIYLPDQKELFARICGFFGRAQLSILEARIHTTRHGYALDTFDIHDPASPNASYREAMSYIEYELKQALTTRAPLSLAPAGRISRHLKHFPLTPEIRVFPDDGNVPIPEIVAGDRSCCWCASPTCWRPPMSTSPAPRSTPWANGPKTFSCSTGRACTTRRRCSSSSTRSTNNFGCSLQAYSSGVSTPGKSTLVNPSVRMSRMRIG